MTNAFPNTAQEFHENGTLKKPNWLRVKLPTGEGYKHVRGLVNEHKLHTICESGNCYLYDFRKYLHT